MWPRFGIDIWMTVTAIAEGFRVGQAYLGAKLHDAKDPGSDLTSMFRQVVGSFFSLMESYDGIWKNVQACEAVPMFGFPFEVGGGTAYGKYRSHDSCRAAGRQRFA